MGASVVRGDSKNSPRFGTVSQQLNIDKRSADMTKSPPQAVLSNLPVMPGAHESKMAWRRHHASRLQAIRTQLEEKWTRIVADAKVLELLAWRYSRFPRTTL